jgi:uncharacterized protein
MTARQPKISLETKAELLSIVDTVAPTGAASVWLVGSRAKGTARNDSDWDLLAVHPDALSISETGPIINHISWTRAGQKVEIVVIAPADWNDPRRFMTDCRAVGVRLR